MKQWDPSFYNSSSNLQYDVALSIIHAERIPTDAKILDVGCGSGKITHYLSQLTPSGDVKGIDLDEKMVAYAKAHNASAIRYPISVASSIEREFNKVLSLNISAAVFMTISFFVTS